MERSLIEIKMNPYQVKFHNLKSIDLSWKIPSGIFVAYYKLNFIYLAC